MRSKKVVLSTLALMLLVSGAGRIAGMAAAPAGAEKQAVEAAQEATKCSAALEEARQWASLLEGRTLKGAGCDYLGSMPAAMLSYALLKRDLELIDLSGSGIGEPVSVPAGALEVNLSNNVLTGCEDEILPCLLSPKTYWPGRLGTCFREETDFTNFLTALPEAPAEATLRMLDLSNCGLTRVPTLCSEVNLANLEVLDLRGNDFEDGAAGLSALVARLPKLKRLHVEARYWKNLALTDPLWTERLCSVITELGFSNISFAGREAELGAFLARFSRLRSLTLCACKLGRVPQTLPATLEVLKISYNNFSAEEAQRGLWRVVAASQLKRLDVNWSKLTLAPTEDLPATLEGLDISSNDFGAEEAQRGLWHVVGRSQLKKIGVNWSKLTLAPTEALPATLEELDISSNDFGAEEEQRRLWRVVATSQLKRLDVHGSELTLAPTEALPAALEVLDIRSNNFGAEEAQRGLWHVVGRSQLKKIGVNWSKLTLAPTEALPATLEELNISENNFAAEEVQRELWRVVATSQLKMLRVRSSKLTLAPTEVLPAGLEVLFSDISDMPKAALAAPQMPLGGLLILHPAV